MSNYIYRFRRLEQLLGTPEDYTNGFDELRKQTIYFSPPEYLNDPMEGFKDIFWCGDEVIWKNLLLHYLMCLEHIFILFVINDENDPIKLEHIPVEISSQDFPTQEFKELHIRISQKFFSSSVISEYLKSLANRTSPIRRNELFGYLQILHRYALKCVYEVFVASGLMMPWSENDIFANAHDLLEKTPLCDAFNQLEQRYPHVTNGVEKFMEVTALIAEQQAIITQYNAAQEQSFFPNRWFLINDFPKKYVNRLEKLLHPEWYTASFASCHRSSSMWGHYAGNHQGICLKFKAGNGNSASINLHHKNSDGGSKDNIRANAAKLYKIQYESKHPPIDFFRSLGKLPEPRLNSTWYFGDTGAKSACYDDVFTEEGIWRQGYWDDFYRVVTTKTKDWEYEAEQRLIIAAMHLDFSGTDDRCTKYDFSDLEGIIFGIKTPDDKKLAVMRIIEDKCRELGRGKFSFYQAYYSSESGKIEAKKLELFKFNQNQSNKDKSIA